MLSLFTIAFHRVGLKLPRRDLFMLYELTIGVYISSYCTNSYLAVLFLPSQSTVMRFACFQGVKSSKSFHTAPTRHQQLHLGILNEFILGSIRPISFHRVGLRILRNLCIYCTNPPSAVCLNNTLRHLGTLHGFALGGIQTISFHRVAFQIPRR